MFLENTSHKKKASMVPNVESEKSYGASSANMPCSSYGISTMPMQANHEKNKKGKVIIITKDYIGAERTELSIFLLKNFLLTLCESSHNPKKVILLNSAIQLANDDSDSLSSLLALQDKGVYIGICSISQEHFEMNGKIAVGCAISMEAIVNTLMEYDVVTI